MLDIFIAILISVGISLVVIRHPTLQRIAPAVFYGTIAAFIVAFSIAFLLQDLTPNTDTMTSAEVRDLPGYIQSFQVLKSSALRIIELLSDPYAHFMETWVEAQSLDEKVFLVCGNVNCPLLMQPLMYVFGLAVGEVTNSPKIILLSIQLTIIVLAISASLSFFSEIAAASRKDKISMERFKYGATLLFLSSGLIFWSLGSWLRWGLAIVITLHLLIAIKREQSFWIVFISILAILTHTGAVFLLPVFLLFSSNRKLRVFAAFTGFCLAAVTFSVTDGLDWQVQSITMLNHFVKVRAFSVGELSGILWAVLGSLIAFFIAPIDRYLKLIPIPNLPISVALASLLTIALNFSFGSGPAERVALGYVIIFSLFVLQKFIQTQTSELFKTQTLGIIGILLYLGSLILYFPSGGWL